MLEQTSGFPRTRTLLPEAQDPPSDGVSACAGKPDVFSAKGRSDATHGVLEVLTRGELAAHIEVVCAHTQPARPGRYAPWPSTIDERLVAQLEDRGIAHPYAHQARAIDACMRGSDVVIATATASGKSLCYQVPIVQSVLEQGDARALLLFPTKALARDQVEAMRGLAAPLGVGTGTYDGDTPPDERRATRARAHVVATNPDMLHRAVLPNHDRWSALLASLRYVVLDEMHTYRGVFGSHVAHVLRRLLRLCAHHGSSPVIIGCSATIANPGELMGSLTARDPTRVELVDEDTAPKGARSFVVLNPSIVDSTTGVRRDYLKVTRRVTGAFRRAGVRTLAFCRTRKSVELLTRYLQEDEMADDGGRAGKETDATDGPYAGAMHTAARDRASKAIRGYRGGYLPEHRRAVEKALRDGEARVVATTNALELGMDIGGLDGVVLAGYPGTRAATWQRSGRAGRASTPSLTALVLSSRPLDQCIAMAPGFLFDEPPEHARIDPTNPEIMVPHLRCATYELPFRVGEGPQAPSETGSGPSVDVYPGLENEDLVDVLDYLVDMGSLHVERDQSARTYVSIGASFPADAIDLRGTLEENFEVVEERGGHFEHGRILAEVDFSDGPLYLHPGAVYPLEGKTYEVRHLDWDGRKAYVRLVSAAYYTEAIIELRVRVLEPGTRVGDDAGRGASRGEGHGQVVRAVPAFKKLRFRTHENIGFGPVNVPELDLQTSMAWWTPSAAWAASLADPRRRADAIIGAAHVLHHVGAMVCMCDVRDLGRAIGAGAESFQGGAWAMGAGHRSVDLEREAGARASIYLYDNMAGGAGLSPRLFELGPTFLARALDLVMGCRCERGCPTCVGADVIEPAPRIGLRAQPQHAESSTGPTPAPNRDARPAVRGHLRADVISLLRDLADASEGG